MAASDSILEAIAEALNSATRGIPEYGAAGALATGDWLAGRGFNTNEELAGIRQAMAHGREDLGPVGTLGADVIGGAISPLNKLQAIQDIYKAKGLTGIGARAGLNGILSGITSALSGHKLEDVENSALEGAAISGALDTIASPILSLLGKFGGKTLDASMGVNGKVQKKFLEAFGEEGPVRLKQALQQVKNQGSGDYSQLIKGTASFAKGAQENAGNVEGGLGDTVNRMIDIADRVKGPNQPLEVNYAQNLANANTSLNKPGVENRILDNIDAFEKRYPNQTLKDMQAEKAAQNLVYINDPVGTSGDDIFRKTLRKTIESATDDLAQQGIPGFQVGKLAELNKQRQAQIILQDAFEAQRPAALAANPANIFRAAGQTTGGLSPASIAAAGHFGGKVGAFADAAVNAMGYFKPVGRVGGAALEDLAGAGKEGIPALKLGINGLLNGDETIDQAPAVSKPTSNYKDPLSDLLGSVQVSGSSQAPSNYADPLSALLQKTSFDSQGASMQDNSDVPAKLVDAMIRWESGTKKHPEGNPNAVSPKGAQGLMQIEQPTWEEWAPKVAKDDPKVDVSNPFDPYSNKAVGTAYIGSLLGKYKNDVPTALAAYNWGLGRVDKAHAALDSTDFSDLSSVLPDATQNYVKNIMADYEA